MQKDKQTWSQWLARFWLLILGVTMFAALMTGMAMECVGWIALPR